MSTDPLADLKARRGDEMPPGMIATVVLAQLWLALATVLATVGSIAAGLAIAFALFGFRTTPALIFAYLAVALPSTALGYGAVKLGRRKLAKVLARRLEARLDGVGGFNSPAALSLRAPTCRHARVTVDGVDVEELKQMPPSRNTRKMFMLNPTCAICGALVGVRELGTRIEPGGDLYDARFEWHRPPLAEAIVG